MIGRDDIEALRARHDIVEVVGATVELRRGKGLCPFHDENTPSLSVIAAKQVFHCFGCGAGGDVFAWVMRTRNCTFPEALDILGAGSMSAGGSVSARPRCPPSRSIDPEPFWRQCSPPAIGDAYLSGRSIDPSVVAAFDLARYTPPAHTGTFPDWWPRGRANCWRLVARGWSAEGVAVNLHGRAVVTPPSFDGRPGPKTLWARDARSAGVVFWNRIRPAASPLVVIAEGMTDYLTLAVWGAPRSVPVFGATSGGFAAFRDIAIPEGTPIVACPDEDPAGDQYMSEIIGHYPKHRIRRLRPSTLMPAERA